MGDILDSPTITRCKRAKNAVCGHLFYTLFSESDTPKLRDGGLEDRTSRYGVFNPKNLFFNLINLSSDNLFISAKANVLILLSNNLTLI